MKLLARRLEATTIIITVLLLGVTVQRAKSAGTQAAAHPATAAAARSTTPRPSRDFLEQLAESAAAGAPFRLAATPADVRFGEWLPPQTVLQVEVPRPKPQFDVKAILGGPPWRAIVRGFPGANGDVVVRVGDRFPPFAVRSISHASVEISGADSTWSILLLEATP